MHNVQLADVLDWALCAERATSREVRQWLDEAMQEGRSHVVDRLAPVASALQRLSEEVEEDRAQTAAVAGDYTPHQLQVQHYTRILPW